MTVIVESRQDLTLENFERVAFAAEEVEIGQRAFRTMASARESGMRLLHSGHEPRLNGTQTTPPRTGHPAPPVAPKRQVDPAIPVASPSFGGGGVLDQRVVRGILFARLANLIDGHVRARPVIAERIASMLDGSPLPTVPLGGQVGPGEVVPLLSVMGSISGSLEAHERMALLGGSPCAAALAADLALSARHRLNALMRTFALAVEAFGAPVDAFDAALDELWQDEHEQLALRELRRHLEDGQRGERRTHPAPVSFRIIPRVLGQAYRAAAALEHAARVSLRSVTDDCIYLQPDSCHPNGRVLATGGSHNGAVYPAMSALAGAWADVVFLAERLVTALQMDAERGLLPDRVNRRSDLLGWVACGFLEQSRDAAVATLLPSGFADAQNDVASPAFAAYGKLKRSGECVDATLAVLSASASHALWRAHATAAPPLQALLAGVLTIVPVEDPDPGRTIGEDLAQLSGVFAAAALSGAIVFPETPPTNPESARETRSVHAHDREDSGLPRWWWGPE